MEETRTYEARERTNRNPPALLVQGRASFVIPGVSTGVLRCTRVSSPRARPYYIARRAFPATIQCQPLPRLDCASNWRGKELAEGLARSRFHAFVCPFVRSLVAPREKVFERYARIRDADNHASKKKTYVYVLRQKKKKKYRSPTKFLGEFPFAVDRIEAFRVPRFNNRDV